ncbi:MULTISPECIES: HAD-IIA family hydrolase [unclassified Arthrobacter]|uniref:HAD-IIA family hydrolase n=1 Tax=unclassified Arthrobacter TaxID=235627 RepID=UPI001E5432CE|nr:MULTISPECIES: HAD-IIA family hydrolase [unclassified Arthrobacter]MCC9144974.1 HAD-IIA family hydrolase [Arthrobacter sp. zg-Y919]MDK1276202.1 HAD-IIA family hydrolase [Arthrobacter sp. zg.Y919]MDM7988840.1 HAD-IIA family hydrolase [Arthrobacter sp. zg-Y877]WIB02185.1 HAD-IIA family hydrolase [Arthrobacter sp. zg-Y919]
MTTNPSLVSGYDAVFSDLDGVVYAGPHAIPGAVEALDRLADVSVQLAYVTNNASRSSETVAAHLRELGAPATAENVFGSAQAGAELLASKVPAGAKVLVTGSATLAAAVEAQGLVRVYSADDAPDAVIQGFDPSLGWADLAEAAFAVGRGAVWVATNTDLSIPQARGIAPGNGTLVAAVGAATGRVPFVAGKPEAPLFTTAARHLDVHRPLVVGDRLDTDILGGTNAGFDTALVLTGVDTPLTALAARKPERPVYLIENLAALFEPYPVPVPEAGKYRCGQALAWVEDTVVVIAGDSSDLDSWRAGCAAWWAARPDAAAALTPEIRWTVTGRS